MALIDLTDANYSALIENSLQDFLAFQFQGKFYRYACSPNGLTSAPRMFTKIMTSIDLIDDAHFSC